MIEKCLEDGIFAFILFTFLTESLESVDFWLLKRNSSSSSDKISFSGIFIGSSDFLNDFGVKMSSESSESTSPNKSSISSFGLDAKKRK